MLCAFLAKIVTIKHNSPMGLALRQRSGKRMLHLFFSIYGALGSRLAHCAGFVVSEFNGQYDEIKKVMVAKSVATLCTEFAEEDPESYSRTKCPSPQVFSSVPKGLCISPHSLQQK